MNSSPVREIQWSADELRPERMRWRFLISEPMPGAENMALDEALLARARRTGEAVLRVYSWAKPTLSLGRHQRARGIFDPHRARDAGVDIVRRITGGRALLHHREVTYSVTSPVDDKEHLAAAYARINGILLRALDSLGVAVSVAPADRRMPSPGSAPCFEFPAPGELTFAGRKLVGSAQVREGGALLQHGSILIDDDQGLVAQLAMFGTPAAAAATLREALGYAPSVRKVAEALFTAVGARNADDAWAWTIDPATAADCAVAKGRYESEQWTFGR